MDRQKIFWVVLSVSVLVVIVLVVGVLLLKQKPAALTQTPALTPLSDTGTQVYEYQQSPGTTGTQTGQGDSTQTMHFYIGEGAPEDTTGTPAPTATVTEPVTQTPPVTVAPLTTKPAATTASRSVTKPSVSRTAQSTLEYWIQTGAYRSPTKADELVSLLGKQSLTGRVFSTTSQKGETLYRVRVGPYTNKGEAEKFLSIVKKVQGLETSYISQVGSTKTPVN